MRRYALMSLFVIAAIVAWFAFQKPSPLTGTVRDSSGPVANALVRWQNSPEFTLTDDLGRFQLSGAKSQFLTAAKPGYLIASLENPTDPANLILEPLPTDDNDDYCWIDPSPRRGQPRNCGNCHADHFRDWSTSAHGNSARNPKFLAVYAGPGKGSLLSEYPEGQGVCAGCHAPTLRGPGFDYDIRQAKGVDSQGVHCDFCHKIVDAPTDKLGTRFGRDGLELLRPARPENFFLGPLDDAIRPGEAFGYSPLYRESRYCASCHEGVIFGVHAYSTYSEYLASPAAKKGLTCQNCHMKPKTHRLTDHAMPGGTFEMLRACLDLKVATAFEQGSTKVQVTIRADDVGHRVPTGFIDRHLVLVVEPTEPAMLLEGDRLPAMAGLDAAGQLFGRWLERDGVAPQPFWAAGATIMDRRLEPGRDHEATFRFAGQVSEFRVRLLYRRFWQALAKDRGWTDNELAIFDRTFQSRKR